MGLEMVQVAFIVIISNICLFNSFFCIPIFVNNVFEC